MTSASKSRSKWLSFALKFILTLLILYFVLSAVPVHEYRHALALLSWQALLTLLLLAITQIIFLALRWYLLAKAAGSHLSIPNSIFGILMSLFFSQGLPASVGGDAFRIWWHRREGIETSHALKIIFFDRIYGMLSLIFLSIGSVFLLAQYLGGEEKIVTLILFLMILGALLGLFIMPWRIGVFTHLEKISNFLPDLFKKILQWVTAVRLSLSQQKLRITFNLLIIGLIIHVLVVSQVFVIGHVLSPSSINVIVCLAAVPPALFISYMPFSIAGWGVREASMVVTFGLFGVPASIAILISLSIGMVILCLSLIGGLMWMLGGFRGAYALDTLKLLKGNK